MRPYVRQTLLRIASRTEHERSDLLLSRERTKLVAALSQFSLQILGDLSVQVIPSEWHAERRENGDLRTFAADHVKHGDVERAAAHVEHQQAALRLLLELHKAVGNPGNSGSDGFLDEGQRVRRHPGLGGESQQALSLFAVPHRWATEAQVVLRGQR